MVRRFTHSELPVVAGEILNYLKQPRIIVFYAPMGAGKTTLVHALCDALGVKDPVGSPTFSIINEYASASGPVFHIDCYRLKSEEEAVDAGIEDCLDGNHWCFVEWAEKIPHLLPDNLVIITIRVEDPTTRYLELRDSTAS
ncbi:MAG: tRNA (adenosine(37)-N6)-threonylcarbamoyltransferase complex ATPase subunit type 1 TsaE [Flavihumibacter sp.]|jgi:tRNA threonylcarbamoyladenosine biosynthesis protein TsaE|nr:tRNA (adenosine(37)-N6)-threonylcarbamoyltransferase complex ATPase subunit type 1 TsaE [Flavihumibacter sp.]